MEPKLFIDDIVFLQGSKAQNVLNELTRKNIRKHSKTSKYAKYSWLTHQQARDFLKLKLPENKKIISFYSPKGGVGKTTLAREVGLRAYTWGLRVLFVDLDFNSTITSSFMDYREPECFYNVFEGKISIQELKKEILPGLDIIPSGYGNSLMDRFLFENPGIQFIKNEIDKIKDKYDLIIFDSPPSNSECVNMTNRYSKNIIIPTIADPSSIKQLSNYLETIRQDNGETNYSIKMCLNNFDKRNALDVNSKWLLYKNPGLNKILCKTFVSKSIEIATMRADFDSIFCYNPIKNCQKEISGLTKEILLL